MDDYVKLAKKSLECYIREKRILSAKEEMLPKELTDYSAGAFVSLKENGNLRGCIGTIEPVEKNLAEEIIHNAVSAGIYDPRFPEVTAGELDFLEYSVDVLTKPEDIVSAKELDPRKYGVIVANGHRRGLLLPDLEGVDTPEEQIRISMQKAGIMPGEPVALQRFEAVRHY